MKTLLGWREVEGLHGFGAPMHLDMQTMSAVNVTVTAILGGVLLFTWTRERESPFVGWWGLALLIQAAGVAVAAAASPVNAREILYVAKRAGRNRVELLGPDDASPLAEVEAVVRAARRKLSADLADPFTVKLRA